MLTRELATSFPDAYIVSLEYSADQLSVAQHNKKRNISFIRSDAHRIPILDHSVDVAFCRYVLEHLRRPSDTLREIYRTLRPGGKIFLQENNILTIEFDPDLKSFARLWKKFVILQRRLGGDALIGKRLFPLLKEAGFRKIELSIQPEVHFSGKSSFRPWVENLIDIIRGSKKALVKHRLTTPKEITLVIDELHRFLRRDDATAFFYWNRASAVK